MNIKKKLVAQFYWLCFLIISGIELYAVYTDNFGIRSITKPLLMISLGAAYYYSTLKNDPWVLAALGFSFLGDVLLMQNGEGAFLKGIASFLITQVIYVKLFYAWSKELKSQYKRLITLPFIALYIALIYVLSPSLGGLLFPMAVYGFVLFSMGAMSVWVSVKKRNYTLGIGGILFVISDASIALGKYMWTEVDLGLLVMTTYILAQGLIIWSILKIQRNDLEGKEHS
ncbi:MAG: lysoplasmalogenase [Flavobacteriaceae bacterium]